MLTLNEKKLIADALNGCGLLIQCNPNYIHQMMGDNGALKNAAIIGSDPEGRVLLRGSTVCSGLEHEIYDAIRLNRLDEKWEVNGADLIHKIRSAAEQSESRRNGVPARKPPQTVRFKNSYGPFPTPEILAIATSTGGPRALEQILPVFPRDLPIPILIVRI